MPAAQEPPPPPDTAAWAALPEPLGPRDAEIGCPVGVRLALARNERAAVVLNGITAYRAGFELELSVRLRSFPPGGAHWADAIAYASPPRSADAFQLAIELADGRTATLPGGRTGGRDPVQQPVLVPRGASAEGRRFDGRYWLALLPPPGPVVVVCAWPAAGLEASRTAIDAAVILEAAARSELLWPGEPPPPGAPGWVSSGAMTARTRGRGQPPP